jgi:uncharacterized pyridoxamine 5'-phosphate oxidase family protein
MRPTQAISLICGNVLIQTFHFGTVPVRPSLNKLVTNSLAYRPAAEYHSRILIALETLMVIHGSDEMEMKPVDIFNRCLDLLKAERICALATSLSEKPRVRAMEYCVADSGIIFMLTEGGRKVRDILLNPEVSLAVWVTGAVGKTEMRGLTINARAEVVDRGDSKRFPAYYAEYIKHIGRKAPTEDNLPPTVKLIRVIPDVMELFEPGLEEQGYAAKQVWRR